MADTKLTRTPSSAGNRKTFTWSGWIKRGNIDSGYLFTVFQDDNNRFDFGWHGTGILLNFVGGSSEILYVRPLAEFRDPSAWYHLLFSIDTTNATASDRFKIYINGVRVTDFVGGSEFVNNFSQNDDTVVNTTNPHAIGANPDGGNPFDGYMSHVHFIDGTAYAASTFGSTATNGQWVPNLNPSVTYGTNGYFLKFTNASDLGEDFSGNNNDFTKSGSGDQIKDNPQNVFATMNPLNISASMLLKQGNLKAEANGADQAAAATLGITSGKWYFEFYYPAGDNPELGLMPVTKSPANQSSSASTSLDATAFITNNGGMRTGAWSSTSTTGLSSQTSESIIGVAVDANAGKMWFTNGSGTYFNSGNPATGANAQATFDSDWLSQTGGVLPYTIVATGAGNYATANFGQDSSFGGAKTAQNNADGNGEGEFYYAVPSGYLALCTKNLSSALTLPIGKGSSYFNTLTWSGDNTTRSFTGVGFSPDWVWIKSRNAGAGQVVYDSVRGNGKQLAVENSDAELTNPQFGYVSSFGSDGFTTTPGSYSGYESGNVNMSGRTYVGWNWRGSDSNAVSNTDGSITSTISANTTSGFSIVSYTGTGSIATIGHGLGKVPAMMIVKRRSGSDDWTVYHQSLGEELMLRLNTTGAQHGQGTIWNDTAPTSSVFTVSTDSKVNSSGQTYIAYIFADIEGYSKMGLYTGNGNANGPFVYTGFRPAFVIVKNVEQANNWFMMDSVRTPNNEINKYLYPNATDAEVTFSWIDFLSNGFKIRSTGTGLNNSGIKNIYIAFAENPFVDSSGIPVTAR